MTLHWFLFKETFIMKMTYGKGYEMVAAAITAANGVTLIVVSMMRTPGEVIIKEAFTFYNALTGYVYFHA